MSTPLTKPGLICRPAQAADFAAIACFQQEAAEPSYAWPKSAYPLSTRQLGNDAAQQSDITVVERDGKIIAYADFHPWREGLCVIGNFLVAPQARGQGVARHLLDYMESLAVHKHGAREIRAACFNPNTAGLLFCMRAGFHVFDSEEGQDKDGERLSLIHLRKACLPDATACAVKCHIVGILDDGWAGLGDHARKRIRSAGAVIGAARTLDLVRAHIAADARLYDMDGVLAKVPEWVRTELANARSVIILATGDPFCHGLAAWLIDKLEAGGVQKHCIETLPAPSTLQLAFARWQKPWQDVCIASCHSKDAGEWQFGATPAHGLYPLMRAISLNARVFAFTGPENDPARLARALMTTGHGQARLSVACRLGLPDEAIFGELAPEQAAAICFPQPCVVLVERKSQTGAEANLPAFGLDDLDYRQRSPEKGLITKQEARALSLAKLALRPDAIVWDIGAGSGSMGIEAARLTPQGHVWAIEKNADDAANAHANALRFRLTNYTLHEGKAPDGLADWPDPDAVFIGGSGGELAALIQIVLARLRTDGRLVMNFVTLENLTTAIDTLKQAGTQEDNAERQGRQSIQWDVVHLQASRSQPILDMQRMAAQNPVWIVTARKAG